MPLTSFPFRSPSRNPYASFAQAAQTASLAFCSFSSVSPPPSPLPPRRPPASSCNPHCPPRTCAAFPPRSTGRWTWFAASTPAPSWVWRSATLHSHSLHPPQARSHPRASRADSGPSRPSRCPAAPPSSSARSPRRSWTPRLP